MGKNFNKRTKMFIGQTFEDRKRNFTIKKLESREKTNGEKELWCQFHCNICGWDNGWIRANNIRQGDGCGCCANKVCVQGINDFATTHSEKMKYLVDIENGYKYTAGSIVRIETKCPLCGDIKMSRIKDLADNEYYICNRCGDGKSIPEKFVYSVLLDSGVDFIYQFSKRNAEWCGKFYYDFYLPKKQMIIEVNGAQHSKINHNMFGMPTSQIIERDTEKVKLAINNGIKVYAYVDASLTNFEYIKQSLLEDDILVTAGIDPNSINWNKCAEFATTSLIKEVCEYYNSKNGHISLKELGEHFKLAYSTISGYLKKGTFIGLCNYDYKEHKNLIAKDIYKKTGKKVYAYKDNKLIYVFDSTSKVVEQSKEVLGIETNMSIVQQVCKGTRKTYEKYGVTLSYQPL